MHKELLIDNRFRDNRRVSLTVARHAKRLLLVEHYASHLTTEFESDFTYEKSYKEFYLKLHPIFLIIYSAYVRE